MLTWFEVQLSRCTKRCRREAPAGGRGLGAPSPTRPGITYRSSSPGPRARSRRGSKFAPAPQRFVTEPVRVTRRNSRLPVARRGARSRVKGEESKSGVLHPEALWALGWPNKNNKSLRFPRVCLSRARFASRSSIGVVDQGSDRSPCSLVSASDLVGFPHDGSRSPSSCVCTQSPHYFALPKGLRSRRLPRFRRRLGLRNVGSSLARRVALRVLFGCRRIPVCLKAFIPAGPPARPPVGSTRRRAGPDPE